MLRDKTESHKRVLAEAREEFMEYGFENASMRRIGERCGMTAAGLYRHCKDKAGLFEELVTPSIEKINEWLNGHARREIDPKELHILLSAYTTALLDPVVDGYTKEEALRYLDRLEEFFLAAWQIILGF